MTARDPSHDPLPRNDSADVHGDEPIHAGVAPPRDADCIDQIATSSSDGAARDGLEMDLVQRYRYVIEAAPAEAIAHATEEAIALLNTADRQRLQALLEPAPAIDPDAAPSATIDPARLSSLALRAERDRPGSLERILLALSSCAPEPRASSTPWAVFVNGFVQSSTLGNVLAFWTAPGVLEESEPDFSAEFGAPNDGGRREFEYGEFEVWL
jgi:hypothetical protein